MHGFVFSARPQAHILFATDKLETSQQNSFGFVVPPFTSVVCLYLLGAIYSFFSI